MSYEAPHSICTCMLDTKLFSIPCKKFFWCLWHDVIWVDNQCRSFRCGYQNVNSHQQATEQVSTLVFWWTCREWSKMIFLQTNMATNRNHTTLLKNQSSIKYLPKMHFLSNFGCKIIVMSSVKNVGISKIPTHYYCKEPLVTWPFTASGLLCLIFCGGNHNNHTRFNKVSAWCLQRFQPSCFGRKPRVIGKYFLHPFYVYSPETNRNKRCPYMT